MTTPLTLDNDPAGAQGAAARPPRRRAAARHRAGHSPSRPATTTCPPTDVDGLGDLLPHRRAQRVAGALPGAVRAHRRGDADAGGAVPGGLRVRRRPGRRQRGVRRDPVRPRTAHRPGAVAGRGRRRGAGRLRRRREGRQQRGPHDHGALPGHRDAARRRGHCEIAELAIRFRDKGVVGFDIAGAEAGYPPTRHLDAFEYMRNNNAPLHDSRRARRSGCRPSTRPSRSAAPTGSATACASSTTSPSRPTAPCTSAGWRRCCGTSGFRWSCARAPTCRPGAVGSIAEHPFDLLARLPVPRHGQHRQPADERHHDEPGDAAAGGGVRLRLE